MKLDGESYLKAETTESVDLWARRSREDNDPVVLKVQREGHDDDSDDWVQCGISQNKRKSDDSVGSRRRG